MKRVQKWWHVFLSQDWLAILLAAGLLATGLTFIYSASWRGEETGIVGAWFSKQIWWAALGAGQRISKASWWKRRRDCIRVLIP